MFLPTTISELKRLGWDYLDVIIVSGDTYIDSSYSGIAVIGKVLLNEGYRVGIIAQPDLDSDKDILRLGEPRLFWGVSSGCVDSMIANYTSLNKKRLSDDFTPGGMNTKRPDRALIVYSNLIKRYFKNTVPIVLGGIEASLRRIAHYDAWDNKIRRPILFDAKADILIYGMGERAVIELAKRLKNRQGYRDLRGIAYIAKREEILNFNQYVVLPSFEEVSSNREEFKRMFFLFYNNNEFPAGRGLIQQVGNRFLVQNPPSIPLSTLELDRIYNLNYERDVHPYYKKNGKVKALETIRFSITTHRGCSGDCAFCAISIHQGRQIISRSEDSILQEVFDVVNHPEFNGIISDVGGPTANMYGMECLQKQKPCTNRSCIYPKICPSFNISHKKQLDLLRKIRNVKSKSGKNIRAFVASGIRHDLILADVDYGKIFLEEVLKYHTSGQMKIAPEHTEDRILRLMKKPGNKILVEFKKIFDRINQKLDEKKFLTYYFIAAYPGCTIRDMERMRDFVNKELRLKPEQIQIFTPSPSTFSTLMYYLEEDPFTGEKIFVEKGLKGKKKQKAVITG